MATRGVPQHGRLGAPELTARRRRQFYDGSDRLAVLVSSPSDIDDLIPTLVAYELEWNKGLHELFNRDAALRRFVEHAAEMAPSLATTTDCAKPWASVLEEVSTACRSSGREMPGDSWPRLLGAANGLRCECWAVRGTTTSVRPSNGGTVSRCQSIRASATRRSSTGTTTWPTTSRPTSVSGRSISSPATCTAWSISCQARRWRGRTRSLIMFSARIAICCARSTRGSRLTGCAVAWRTFCTTRPRNT